MSEHITLRLTRAISVHQAWWEDRDSWDGAALYLDEETAKTHAADDYEAEEYGRPDVDDEEPSPRPLLTWESEYSRWVLMDDGKDTGVRVGETSVYRRATRREADAQDALAAAEEAAQAARPKVPMTEALETLRATA